MRYVRNGERWVVLAVAAVLVSGCAASKQARGVDENAGVLLSDHSMLREGKEGEALRVYKSEKTAWAKYESVLIEPVLFPRPEQASGKELADLEKLANNLHYHLVMQLSEDYKVVTTPGPNTLRVQTAFFDAKKKGLVGNTLSSIMPPGIAVSLAKDFATGKPLGVGEISAEVKISDAETGELLGAALDRRVGQKYSQGMWDSWAEANDAVEYWAKRMRFAACQLRSGAGCVEP